MNLDELRTALTDLDGQVFAALDSTKSQCREIW
jgi:hypothetical protein